MKYNEVYESFKGYRERRAASRDAFVVKQQHKFVKAIEALGLKSAAEENAKRENANVDGDGPMGTMLHFGSTVSKEFAKAYLMDSKYARAHDEGLKRLPHRAGHGKDRAGHDARGDPGCRRDCGHRTLAGLYRCEIPALSL